MVLASWTRFLGFPASAALAGGADEIVVKDFIEGKLMKRKASAEWQGDLKNGKGSISTGSGVLTKTQYSFSTRFEEGIGTNPEELIAAAHAGCFSMALSNQLAQHGLTAESINTTATVTLEKLDSGFAITEVNLDLVARIPQADKAKFDQAVEEAKTGCPISKLFNAKISLQSKLESAAPVS
jgi:osmotically inducible protein OsmC